MAIKNCFQCHNEQHRHAPSSIFFLIWLNYNHHLSKMILLILLLSSTTLLSLTTPTNNEYDNHQSTNMQNNHSYTLYHRSRHKNYIHSIDINNNDDFSAHFLNKTTKDGSKVNLLTSIITSFSSSSSSPSSSSSSSSSLSLSTSWKKRRRKSLNKMDFIQNNQTKLNVTSFDYLSLSSNNITSTELPSQTTTIEYQPTTSDKSKSNNDDNGSSNGNKNLCKELKKNLENPEQQQQQQKHQTKTSSSSSSNEKDNAMIVLEHLSSMMLMILPCGNDSDSCFYLDSKCNGVSDCPNGFDESIEMCGCMDHEFQCNQTCMDTLLIRCDTKIDCQDGVDEDNCETYVCPETHFKCNNHYCIPTENVCDFQDNCGDNSDEEACTHRACWFGEYKCDNGQCIQAYGVCNGHNDCVDGSDEKQCNPMDFVTCNQSGIHVHRSLWCDGRPDCPINHEDELGCRTECEQNEFRCQNTRCIAMGNRCDTICDCAGTCEDEHDCEQYYTKLNGVNYCSPRTTISCSLSDDGKYVDRCLNNDHVCNGYNDCPRLFDDEYGCPYGGYTEESCMAMKDHFWCAIEHRCLPVSVRCNHIQECFDGYDELHCDTKPCTDGQYQCLNGQCIDMAHRCDSHFDCFDKSDEINCLEHECPERHRRCGTGQCIPEQMWCDYFQDCLDNSDELDCPMRNNIASSQSVTINNCDPLSEFRCDNGQCIPLIYRCLLTENPRLICADRSNLNGCRDFTCESNDNTSMAIGSKLASVKCAGSFCVQQSLKCNERLDCPVLSDWADEQFCPFYCSESRSCRCIDTTINCSDQSLTNIPDSIEDQILRMILKGNRLGHNLTLNMFERLDRMHMIDLSENQIHYIPPGLFRKLWKLRILHLRKNTIELIDSYTFTGLPNVGTLSLNGNHIRLIREHAFSGLASLKTLDLSNQKITSLQKNSFSGLRSLKNLDLSNNQITELYDGVFSGLSSVISIDLRGNKIKNVGSKTFQGLNALKQITFDEFRFCCLVRHVENCYPSPNEFSSCEDLMSNTILRICIWCLGSIALFGNLFVIMWRVKYYQAINRVHSFLIINLALGDLLMGVYLLIIASVDSYYRGIYFIVDAQWRQSSLCHFAGFLSTLSSEFSVFALIVITIDRLITITFPFRIYRIHSKQAKLIIISLWAVAILLSGLPLIPLEYFDNFYGRSGVCLALHITHERPNGWEYSVFIFLVLNLLSFTLICCSYLWMFIVARNTQKATSGSRHVTTTITSSSSSANTATTAAASTETKVQNRMARRMMFIVMTDFCCWMPIITLGIVSLFGVRIPPQVFAWIAVFVLPLNAAVNPTLYTLSGVSLSRLTNMRTTSHGHRSLHGTASKSSPNNCLLAGTTGQLIGQQPHHQNSHLKPHSYYSPNSSSTTGSSTNHNTKSSSLTTTNRTYSFNQRRPFYQSVNSDNKNSHHKQHQKTKSLLESESMLGPDDSEDDEHVVPYLSPNIDKHCENGVDNDKTSYL